MVQSIQDHEEVEPFQLQSSISGQSKVSSTNSTYPCRMKPATKRKRELKEEDNKDSRYEVLKIVKKREVLQNDGTYSTEYRVGWKGYKSKDDTWVPVEDMDATELITEFKVKTGQK